MARLKFLPLLLVVSLSYAESIKDSPQCPQHCRCQHAAMYVMNVRCTKVTTFQQFPDPIVSFTLEKDVDGTEKPLELTSNFFIQLGNNFEHVDSINITADIDKIDRDAFQGLNSLNSLTISNNGLTFIHPDTFSNNKALTLLSLTRNPLTFGEYFLNNTELLELDISFGKIRIIPENAFIALTALTFLNLESNLIDTIHRSAFAPLLELEELNLAHNNLHKLSSDIFLMNDVINVLNLGHNPLISIENLKLPTIDDLCLEHTNLTEITSDTFSSYERIVHLNLSGNSIEKIAPDAFLKLFNLRYLDLSNNKLGPLNPRVFLENRYLETLSLRDNPTMANWPKEGFEGEFPLLHYLDISNIGLQSLAPESLKTMPKLATVDLSRNALKVLEKGVLSQKVVSLSLAHNEISSVEDINIPNKIHQLFLQGNKIKYLTPNNFDNLPYLSKLDVSSCQMESVWLGGDTGEKTIKNLHQLNLANNRLYKILPNDLNVFTDLKMLDIRGNPFVCNQHLDTLINYLQDSSIEPMGSSNIGNIDENFESFYWDDIKTNVCDSPTKLSKKPIVEETTAPVVKSTTNEPKYSTKANSIPTDEREFPVGDMYDDIITDDNDDFEYDQENYDTTRLPHHKPELVPQVVEVSDTSPVVVAFFSALLVTVIITLALALLAVLCKQKFTTIRVIQRRPHRHSGSVYRALTENEHINSPTTPIVKKAQLPHLDVHGKEDNYIQTVNDGTYSSTDFHHSNITPQTV